MLSKCRICSLWQQRDIHRPVCSACGNRDRTAFFFQLPLPEFDEPHTGNSYTQKEPS